MTSPTHSPKPRRTSREEDYPKEAYGLLSKIEREHFWFRGRNAVIASAVRAHYPNGIEKSILEIGCGSGAVLSLFAGLGFRVSGLDMHEEGLAIARRRIPQATLTRGDLFTFLVRKRYGAVGMFDVIEHTDDASAVGKAMNLLQPNGILIMTVPAGPGLWSSYDVISGHKRRYTEQTLRRVVEASGLRILHIGYFGFLQYLPHFFLKRILLAGRRPRQPLDILKTVAWQPPGIVNALLTATMIFDIWLGRYVALPFGTSLIVIAQRRYN